MATTHGKTVIAASGTAYAPATSSTTSVFPTFPRGSEVGQLYLRVTASAAIDTTTDAVYILAHDSLTGTGVRVKQYPDDTAPFNLLDGWNGQTQVDDVIPFRLPANVSVEFVSSDSGCDFTLSGDLTFTTVS